MPKYARNDIYRYDEPMTYSSFNGGINTDPSNENLLDNEIKDAVNFTYNSVILEKRKGAKLLRTLVSDAETQALMLDNTGQILSQGTFLFSSLKNSYLVVARNGRLFYGLYTDLETMVLKPLRIDVSKYYLDEVYKGDHNPRNLCLNLSVKETVTGFEEHTGYVRKWSDTNYEFVFQNIRDIEGAVNGYKLYIPTGTRFACVEEIGGELHAALIDPKITYGTEQVLIGFNYLSPYPERLVDDLEDAPKTAISNIVNTKGVTTPTKKTFKATMAYGAGKTVGDYRFRWELSSDNGRTWTVLSQYRDQKADVTPQPVTGKGMDSITLSELIVGTTYRLRCSFAGAFSKSMNPDDNKMYYDEEIGGIDWVVDKADGEWFGQATVTFKCEPEGTVTPVNQTWLDINSCVKITADGNKLLLYDDINRTGNWYKTVIGKQNYITDRGCLNFQTGKNEAIIKVVNFKGAIVVFANNVNLGGNVAIVTGNGDDVSADQYYSPYQRRVVNTKTTCDNANSVQMTDNFLLFKNGDTVYLLDSSELTNEVVGFLSVNDRIKPTNRYIRIPWEDQNYITEVTPEYYGIIWNPVVDANGRVVREGQRWKLYYNYMQRIDTSNKVFFPWLRDISPIFDLNDVITVNGISTILSKGDQLMQFTSDDYTDNGYIYPISLKLKGADLGYGKLIKMLHSVILYYYRDQTEVIKLNTVIRNEAGFILVQNEPEAFIDADTGKVMYDNKEVFYGGVTSNQDKRVLIADETILGDNIRLDSTTLDTKLIIPDYKFPFLSAETELRMTSPQYFSLSSITYNYLSTDLPDTTVFDLYRKIVTPKELKG